MFFESFKKNTFLRNFSILSVGEVLSRSINMLTNIILARALAPEIYGKYALFMTYLIIFNTISSFGLQHIVIRTIARNQNNSKRYFILSLILRIKGFIISVIAFVFFSRYYNIGFNDFVVFSLLAGVFLNSFWDAFQNVAFGMERMEWTSIINVSMSLILLLTYLLIPSSILSIEIVVGVFVISAFIKDVFYLLSLYKSNMVTGNYVFNLHDKTDMLTLLKDSMPYYILAIFTLFSSQLPIIFLENNSGSEHVAFFNTANKLLLPLSLVLMTALNALFPNQSKLFVVDKDAFARKVKKILLLLGLFGIGGATIISLFRNELVFVLYGEEYVSTGDVMAYQAWYIVLYSIFCFIGSTFGAANKQKLVAVTSIVYALISMPILWYSSYYGSIGLARGYIVASIVNMTYCYYYLLKTIDFKISVFFSIKFFFVFLLAFVMVEFIPNDFNIYLRVVILFAILSFVLIKFSWIKTKIINS
jgi:O-antigen/teichoic acid export membrane protein